MKVQLNAFVKNYYKVTNKSATKWDKLLHEPVRANLQSINTSFFKKKNKISSSTYHLTPTFTYWSFIAK